MRGWQGFALTALLLADLLAARPRAAGGRTAYPLCARCGSGARQPLRLRGGRAAEAPSAPESGGGGMSDGSEDDDVGAVVVVPAQATLLEALHPARGEDDDYDVPRVAAASASLSITVTHGAHNLTDAGELALCRRVQLAASPGVTLAAYAQPPPRGEIFPEVGGGRLHFMEGEQARGAASPAALCVRADHRPPARAVLLPHPGRGRGAMTPRWGRGGGRAERPALQRARRRRRPCSGWASAHLAGAAHAAGDMFGAPSQVRQDPR